MKEGDLVRVKEFYRLDESYDSFGVLIGLQEDDEGFTWYRIAPFQTLNGDGANWYADYEVEMISEM
jgi:hypothetical protein